MSNLSLQATVRDKKTALANGQMPAVVYGRGQEAQAISVDTIAFNKLFNEAGEATIFTLSIDGTDHDVLIHDYQRDPVSHEISHVDFYAIQKGQKITVAVPLEFIGEAPVEDKEGQVVKVHHELEVECEPRDLPSSIEVDLSVLQEIGDSIQVSDLQLPATVTPLLEADEVLVTTSEVKEIEEEEEESAADVDLSAIEVEGQAESDDAADASDKE